MTISVLIVDDQPIIRAGLRTMLSTEDDIRVVAEARDGVEAVFEAGVLRPDVILMDVRMPRLDGIEATRRITAADVGSAIVIVTTFDDEEYLVEGVRAGAVGFLLKDAGAELLAEAVRTAHRGDTLIDPAMTRALLEHRLRDTDPSAQDEGASVLARLSDREREVLDAVARGLSNADIAREQFITEATVKTHVSNLLAKTDSRSRLQAAVFAYESGFVQPRWLRPTS